MSSKNQSEIYEYKIKVVLVKIKIKFPCRISLELNKKAVVGPTPLTQQNKYHFNQTISLTATSHSNNFQIAVVLFTDKGTRYISGMVKFIGDQLIRSKGERLIIPMTKCLDPDAYCEIVVEDVDKPQLQNKIKSKKSILQEYEDIVLSNRKSATEKNLINQTKSEVNPSKSPNVVNLRAQEYGYKQGPKSQVFKTFTKSPKSKNYLNKNVMLNANFGKERSEYPLQQEQVLTSFPRSTFMETEVYREGYQKLKEKFKRQSQLAKEQNHKRLALEANENSYKLQIMKLKLKCDQQQKLLVEKMQKHRQLNSQFMELQKKDLNLVYIKEQNQNLAHKLQVSEQKIVALINDNNSLRALMSQKSDLSNQTIRSLKEELEAASNKCEDIIKNYELELKGKEFQLASKQNDFKMRSEFMERQRKIIQELEQQAEIKMFQYEKIISNDRNTSQSKMKEFKVNILTLQDQIAQSLTARQLAAEQHQKLVETTASLYYSKRIMEEQREVMSVQMSELKLVRERYIELQKEHRFTEEQLVNLKKHLENSLEDKSASLHEIINKYNEQKAMYNQYKQELQKKVKSQQQKIKQLQVSLEQYKNNQEKETRKIESVTKSNEKLKEQLITYKKLNRSISAQILQLEEQNLNHSSLFQREGGNYKQLAERYRVQKQEKTQEMSRLRQKMRSIEEQLNENVAKNKELKMRLTQGEQKLQKQQKKNKETLQRMQKDFQEIDHQLQNSIIDHKSKDEEIQTLKARLNANDLLFIKNKQNLERQKKGLKIVEEKLITHEKALKQRTQELQNINLKNQQLEEILHEQQQQKAKLMLQKQQICVLLSKKQQIIQILNKEIGNLKNEMESYKKTLKGKEEEEEQYRKQIKQKGQEGGVQKIKLMKLEKEYLKFKQFIAEIIHNELTSLSILQTINGDHSRKNTERMQESRVSVTKSQASHPLKLNMQAAQLTNAIKEKMQEVKKNMWKVVQINKLLKKQNYKMIEKTQEETNKHEFAQLQLHKDIQLLEDEMNNIMNDKEIQSENYDNLMVQLNAQIKEKENYIQDLHIEIQEYQAMVKGLKIDFQNNNDLNQKKVNSLKNAISELNQRIQYITLNIACLQDKNHDLEQKCKDQESEIISYKEMLMKNEKTIIEVKEIESRLFGMSEALKKEVKLWQERFMEHDLRLKSQEETKEKYKSMLEQEENKSKKLNEFINELIVQKQKVIKNSLERSQENNHLQNKIFQLNHHKQLLSQENQDLKTRVETSKQQIKNSNKEIKALEKNINEERLKCSQIMQKMKERQNDIEIKKDYIQIIEKKYHELLNKNYKEIQELSNELQDKDISTYNLNKQLNDQITKVQTQNKSTWSQNTHLKADIQELNLSIYQYKTNYEDLELQLKELRQERNDYQDQCTSKEFIINQKLDEIKRLESITDEQKIYIHNLESQQSESQRQFNHNINELTNDYNFKMIILEKELQQKIDLTMKEYTNSLQKCRLLEEQNQKLKMFRHCEDFEYEQNIKNYQEKLKKIQSQRYNAIILKNNELKLLAEQNKSHFDKIKEKEGQIRKLMLQVEQQKNSINKLQIENTHSNQNSKNKIKILEKEIYNLRQKDQSHNSLKDRVNNILHINQVEVRKIISQAIKRVIEACDKLDSERLYDVTKGLESSVVSAMMAEIDKE